MLIIYVFALIGIFRFRERKYWNWLGILFAWMLLNSLLFSGGGTLENPTGDGLITRQIRLAANDGPGMGIFAIVFLVVYWGVALSIIRKLYLVSKQIIQDRSQIGKSSDNKISTGRKFAEAGALTFVAAAYIYIAFIGSFEDLRGKSQESVSQRSGDDAVDGIARELSRAADKLNSNTPQKLDPITTLTSVTAEGRVLIYHYKLSRMDGTDNELRAFVRDNAVTAACKNADMHEMMKDYGITYRYSYLIPNASSPIYIDATYEECQSLGRS